MNQPPDEFLHKPLIHPHGGVLVDLDLKGYERQEAFENAHALPRLTLTERSLADLECLATGVYSPLTGFVGEEDYHSIVETMRLTSGLAWTIPVTLQVPEVGSDKYRQGGEVALAHSSGELLAVMTIESKFRPDQALEAERVYRTADTAHPGVAAMKEAGSVYLGGPVRLVSEVAHETFTEHRFTPAETRAEFERRGWRHIVAFQTRNPIHRAHEYITKVALETTDGLFLNPLVGTTKSDDVPADVRMKCYDVLMRNYYPHGRVLLGVFPAAMRYAGPREAVMHAIARQNYGSYDAQFIFHEFSGDELAITTMNFEHSFYCRSCEAFGSTKTCPHGKESHVFLSGTRVREMLVSGEMPPLEFSRPEVARILMDAYREKATA